MDKLTIEESRLKEIIKETVIEVLEEMIPRKVAEALEDLEDAKEMAQTRQEEDETMPWDQAQAELRAGGVEI